MTEIFDNIRKLYTFYAPAGELSGHLEFFSESSIEATDHYFPGIPFSIKMFPSFTPTFYINLGSSYTISLAGRERPVLPGQDIAILRDSIAERINAPGDHIFTVKFHPGGLESILGINQSRLLNKVIDLHDIMPSIILTQLHAVSNAADRIRIIENWLLNQWKSRKENHYIQIVNDTIGTFHDSGLQLNNGQLAGKMFTSSKSINRYFNRTIGIGPKKYLALCRARVALTNFIHEKKCFDPSGHGYYDMSHFYREMNRFTGQRFTITAPDGN